MKNNFKRLHDGTVCQGRNVILTNKNVITIYDKWKGHLIPQKGTLEFKNVSKRKAEYPCPNVFSLGFSD